MYIYNFVDKDVRIQFKDKRKPMQSNYHWVEESPNSADYGICICILKKKLFNELINEEIILFEKE